MEIYPFNKKKFGRRMRERREQLNFSQYFVADKAQVCRYSLILMEQGKHVPKADIVFRLLDLYDIKAPIWRY
jgi:transcriptional regulator with XRE-family HTH domain